MTTVLLYSSNNNIKERFYDIFMRIMMKMDKCLVYLIQFNFNSDYSFRFSHFSVDRKRLLSRSSYLIAVSSFEFVWRVFDMLCFVKVGNKIISLHVFMSLTENIKKVINFLV